MGLGDGQYILAEAGTNHAADAPMDRLKNAKECIRVASRAGADAVKFQLFRANEKLFCPMDGDERRWARWNKTLLTDNDWKEIHRYCKKWNIDLILSAFQMSGVELVNELGITHKVASRAIEDYPYDRAGKPNDALIVSLGKVGGTLLPNTLKVPQLHRMRCVFLQCAMAYPVALGRAAWREQDHGLSDHSGTPWPALDALARHALAIEVHFRPHGFRPGPDEPVELTPEELKLICDFRDALAEMYSNE